MRRSQSAADGSKREGSKGQNITATPKNDPSTWSKEVVRALCRRLPGKEPSKRCEQCDSVFYPCLCCAKEKREKNCRQLRPPKVLEESERRRLQKGPMERRESEGNLKIVRKGDYGMKTTRLHVVSAAGANAISTCVVKSGLVIARNKATYTVQLDGDKDWTQEIHLSAAQLEELLKHVDRKTLEVQSSLTDTIDSESANCSEPLKSLQERLQVCVEYTSEEMAQGDLELACSKAWFVKDVRQGEGGKIKVKWGFDGSEAELDPAEVRQKETASKQDDSREFKTGDIVEGKYGSSWFEAEVLTTEDPGAHAWERGVRKGHRVRSLCKRDVKSKTWKKVNEHELLPGPLSSVKAGNVEVDPDTTSSGLTAKSLRKTLSTTNLSKQGTLFTPELEEHVGKPSTSRFPWPCRFTFDVLTDGWRIVGMSDGQGHFKSLPMEDVDSYELLETCAQPGGEVTLRFSHRAYEVVSCKQFKVRHEHVWEKELSPSPEVDARLLQDWCLDAHLSPAHVSFAFRMLKQELLEELRDFHESRSEFEKILLLKVKRLVEAEMSEASNLDRRRSDCLAKAAEATRRKRSLEADLRSIFLQVPLAFLVELGDTCKHAVSCNLNVAPLGAAGATQDIQPEVENFLRLKQHIDTFPKRHDSAMAGSGARAVQEMRSSAPSAQGRPSLIRANTSYSLGQQAGATSKSITWKMFKLLSSEIESALKAAREGRLRTREFINGEIHMAGQEVTAIQDEHIHQERHGRRKDGRLSKKDFEEIMVRSGITWLTSEDIELRFDTIDTDKSGFLNLGEVLAVAQRLSELMLMVKDHQRELEATKKFTGRRDREEVVQSFSTKLLFGDDLVGDASDPAIPNEHIANIAVSSGSSGTLSSLNCTRLNFQGASWRASGNEPEPHITWEFKEPRWITAVVTQGDASAFQQSWVTKFRLERHDPESDTFVCVGEEGEECTANQDGVSSTWTVLREPVVAKAVRLTIMDWAPKPGRPCLKATLYGRREAPVASETMRPGTA